MIPGPLPYQDNAKNNDDGSSNNEVEVAGSKPAQQAIIIDWPAFQEFLDKTYNHNTAKVRLCYAKRYASILVNGDTQDLLAIESEEKRLNVMKSLTVLSRYLGCYDSWQDMRRRHSLKWTSGNESLHAMQRFFNHDLSLNIMLQRIKEMIRLLPLLWVK